MKIQDVILKILDFGGDDNPGIVNDKMLAYAFILTHEGYPCVFWQE